MSRDHKKRKVTFFDFKGLMAPVFSCFSDDDSNYTLEVNHIDQYAAYLKKEKINGVLVNSFTGEGPALGLQERKLHVEKWWQAACKYELICMVQIGGAPLPDVIELARQAETLGVHAVLCLPELFYKPENIDQLVTYCRTVSKHCMSRPFFYYHIPRFTGIHFDMQDFCKEAESVIPGFLGIQYSSPDLEMGYRCLREGRVVLLGSDMLLASGMLLGFDSALMSFLNVRPDLGRDIYNAMNANNMVLAREKQKLLNSLLRVEMFHRRADARSWVAMMKNWFNDENRAQFSAGPVRKMY